MENEVHRTTEFHIGDWVKIVRDSNSSNTHGLIGQEGVVIGILFRDVIVQFDEGGKIYVCDKDLEIVV